MCAALYGKPIAELRRVSSVSVACHPAQVNAPALTPVMQAGTRFTSPGGMEGWVDLGVGYTPKWRPDDSFGHEIVATTTTTTTLCLIKLSQIASHLVLPYLCQILTDFVNSFTGTLAGKLAIKKFVNIPPHLNGVATLPCEGEWSVRCYIVLDPSLDIWRVVRSVCFWPCWLYRPTSSSTVVTFSSVRACFGLPLSCLWSVLLVSWIF